MLDFVTLYSAEILQALSEHLFLVLITMTLAIVTGIPLGIFCARYPRWKKYVMGLANVVQTIPSLALFGFLIPLPFLGGIGARTAIVALTLYSLLPIIRNTCTGIEEIPAAIIDAAQGMGMSAKQILWQVQLPLATGFILAGIRTSAILTIGIATIAAAIGAGGLGVFIFRGVAMMNHPLILAGAIPAALLALGTDATLALAEKTLKKRMGR